MAKTLADRLDYVRINAWRDRSDITHFMPYFAETRSRVKMALFTHRDVGFAKYEEAWDRRAARADCCVALAARYRDMLVGQGARRVEYIEPAFEWRSLFPVSASASW